MARRPSPTRALWGAAMIAALSTAGALDRSAITSFRVGDRVQVLGSQRVGRVSSVWEKCDVDPHCCCAELAWDAPIGVQLDARPGPAEGAAPPVPTAYFAEDELVKMHRRLQAHVGRAHALCFAGVDEDGFELVATAGGLAGKSCVYLWDAMTLRRRRRLLGAAPGGARGAYFSLAAAGEGTLVAGTSTGECAFFGTARGAAPRWSPHVHSGWVRGLGAHGSLGAVFAVGCESLTAHRAADASPAGSLDSGPSPGDAQDWRRHDILSVAVDGDRLWCGLVDGSLRISRAETLRRAAADAGAAADVDADADAEPPALRMDSAWRGHEGRVAAMAAADGVAVSGGRDGRLCLWRDGGEGEPELVAAASLGAEGGAVTSVALALAPGGGGTVHAGTSEGAVRAYRLPDLEEVGEVDLGSAVTALVCTPGHRRVLATTADGYLHRVDGGDGGGGGS